MRAGEAEFLGAATSTAKSLALLSVSVQPPAARTTALALLLDDGPVAPVPSEQMAYPQPTKSTIVAEVGHDPDSAVVAFTKATFPAAELMLTTVVETSAVGRGEPTAPPASCTRKNPLAGIVPLRATGDQDVPMDEPYCTDHPARLTAALPRLWSSTKSFVYDAPAFPPPP
jgi:hypothetical protein